MVLSTHTIEGWDADPFKGLAHKIDLVYLKHKCTIPCLTMDDCLLFACPSKDSLLGSATLLESFAYTNPTKKSPN
jgi:hypothetical protein